VEPQHEQEPRPKFDPQAALEELERFGRDIQRYRAQREAVGDRFETFVRSFKSPSEPATDTVAAAAAATGAAPIFETPATEVSPPAMSAPPEPLVAGEPPPRATPVLAIAAGAAILVGGGLLAALLWNRSPEPVIDATATAGTPAAATPAPTPAPEPGPVSAPPAAAPAAIPPGASELAIDRQVWMRVIVDGARVLEREVPAGTRIPLAAEKTIVIRTGDAGAVRLSLRGGASTPLGREGEVVTRSFTVPPRSEAPR
jgi:hypothetical protein